MMPVELKALFEPKSVVVLGASELKGEPVYAAFFNSFAHNLSKFTKGKVHLVDLSGKLEGCEKSPAKVPRNRDLAIAILSKELLAKNLPKLLSWGIRALILASGELEQKQREALMRLAGGGRLLLLGPNAMMGVINTANGLVATPLRDLAPKRGSIAVISQDGGVAAAILDWACFNGVGMSKFACVGEGLGIDVVTLLHHMARDKETNTICVYIETPRDGRRLIGAIGEVAGLKPVIVLRGGQEEEKVFEAALKQVGAFHVQSVEELFSAAEGLAKQPPMRGDRVAVITNVAGQARLAARCLAEEGLMLVEPQAETMQKISKKYPGTKTSGFVDLGIGAVGDSFKFAVEQVLSDKTVDGLMVINAIKSTVLKSEDICKIAEAAGKSKDKPVVSLAPGGGGHVLAREALADTELPVYAHSEKAARALKVLRLRGKMLEKIERK